MELEPDAAIANWAISYFRSHGPATLRDLLWWTGLRHKDVQPLWDDITGSLERLVVDGVDYYLDPATLPQCEALSRATTDPLLTVAFDEILLGFQARSAVLHPDHFEAVVPGRNGMFRPVVIDGGRAIGTWSRDRHTGMTVDPFHGVVSGKVARALPRLARNPPG
ncbi:DNA glycosylase AlkZ-like family protein [Leekyejoonella antrihumi]|uniref:Winged helix DNA-binding domain-containing protein n=1 Tax=Leekyejoonella antrihumi TaxID=1660198 RepID=A0A563DZV2_9MICO|nr:crosslink repair DNA glycosylase YcaQ family protein [Leekyejoonella antrihumi]TWP35531.1 winged helix DNA-binding domain-containing protein [Leekyejoonella antrihumi]